MSVQQMVQDSYCHGGYRETPCEADRESQNGEEVESLHFGFLVPQTVQRAPPSLVQLWRRLPSPYFWSWNSDLQVQDWILVLMVWCG